MIQPGDKVKFTGRSLNSMGSHLEAKSTWEVLPCNCSFCLGGIHVAVNQPSSFYLPGTDPETAKWRHIGRESLYKVGTSHRDNADPKQSTNGK